jgi:hypothetical protein
MNLQEFYVTANLKDLDLNDPLEEWPFPYKGYRSHIPLQGKTAKDIVGGKSPKAKYDPIN